MRTTLKEQIIGTVLGVLSLTVSQLSIIVSTVEPSEATTSFIETTIICSLSVLCGIIGLVISAGARKAASQAGEMKFLATIGFIISIVGIAYSVYTFFILGVLVSGVLLAGDSIISYLK